MKNKLTLFGTALLLVASWIPTALGQVNDVPAQIDATVFLLCDTNFLNVPGVYNLLISGIDLSGTADGYDFPFSPFGYQNAPGLTGSTHADVAAAAGSDRVLAHLRVCAALGFLRLQPGSPVGTVYSGYDGYALTGSLTLKNGQSYVLDPFWTGWPDPRYYMAGDVNPLGHDPNYYFPNLNPFGINPSSYFELPGILSITLKCPNGSLAPAGIQGTLTATLNDTDEVQARLPSFNSSVNPIYLLVRSDHNYRLDLSYITGSDPAADLVTWPIKIPHVPANPSHEVSGCAITELVATMPTCDIASALDCPATFIGFVDMLGGEVNWPGNFTMNALPGPAGNFRAGRINPVLPAPVDYFQITNIVPSDFFDPYGFPSVPYLVGGQLCFGMNSDYEFFQTALWSEYAIECEDTDLGQVFRMCPGHVQGNISLSGPIYGTARPSPFQSLVLDRTFANNGHNDADPLLAPIPIQGTSHIGATQVGGEALARVLFSAQTIDGGSTLSGRYDLRLAGLSSIAGVPSSSAWNPNQLYLNFSNSLSTIPEDSILENVQITDTNFTGVTVTCGETNLHDINYCFGEVIITILDTNPGDNSYRKVSIEGDIDPTFSSPYAVHFSAVGVVVPTTSPTGNAKGVIRLFLPHGKYKYVTTVETDTGPYNQPASTFTAICDVITEVKTGDPVFIVSGIPRCSSNSNFVATVTVFQPITNYTLSYSIDGVPFTVIDCSSGCAPTTIFGVPLHYCLNEIIFAVSNKVTHVVGKATASVTYSPAPPTMTCNDIVLQVPYGQSTVQVDYNLYNNISIDGGCEPRIVTFDPPNFSSFPVGSTPVICAVTDACHSNYCTFNVVVEPPPCVVLTNELFICNTNGPGYVYYFTAINTQSTPISYLEMFANGGSCLSIVTPIFNFPVPLDQAGLNPQYGSFNIDIGPGCSSPELCVTIVAHDQNGAVVCSYERCFPNPAIPTFNCPPNIEVDCTNDLGAYVSFGLPAGSGLFCCNPVNVTSYPSPGIFPIGVTPVTVVATDSCGHSNSCQFSVTVRGHSSNLNKPRSLRHDGFVGDIQISDAIAVDDHGNSFITGWFKGTAHFGSISLISSGSNDIFLAKFGPDLSGPLWVQKAGGGGDDLGNAVAVDSEGNCYIAGSINAGDFTVSFLEAPVTGGLIPTTIVDGPAKMFLAKYDPDGNLLWVAPADGQSGGSAEGVAIDGNDDCYVCGAFSTVGTFYSGAGGIGTARSAVGSGQSEAYLVKYSSAGDPQWVVCSSGSGIHSADARSVAIDRYNNRAFITGTFLGEPVFGNLPHLGPSGIGFGRVFVAQCELSPTSDPIWKWARQTFSPPLTNCSHDARQIGVDRDGNCYFTAYFNGVASIATDNKTATPALTRQPALSNHYYDYLVGSFGTNGVPRWLFAGPTGGDDESRALAVRTETGDVFMAGFLNGLDDHADGGRNVLLRHFNSLGVPKDIHQAFGTSQFQSNAGRGLAIDAAGCIYMTGSYTDTNLNFQEFQGILPTAHILNSTNGTPKTFVAKYCPACEDCIPALFTSYPQNVINSTGPSVNNPVSFTATVSGSLPIAFFWRGNNVVLNPSGGAISTPCYSVTINGFSSTLTLTCPQAGPFDVSITNSCNIPDFATPPVNYHHFGIDPTYSNGLPSVPLNINLISNLPFLIQYRDDLSPGGVWHDLTNGSGSGSLMQIVDPNPNPTNRFYRLSIPANLP